MSIVDISFTLPMLIGLLLVLFFKKESPTRTVIGRIVALWLCLYASASFAIKQQANSYFEDQFASHGIEATRMMTAPTISNIFLWRMLAEADGQYHIAYLSVFDYSARPCRIDRTPSGHTLLEPLKDDPQVQKLTWFARDWHKVVEDPANGDSLLFIDMRFTEIVTPEIKSPVFVWQLVEQSDEVDFRQVSFRGRSNVGETLSYLWQGIRGNAPLWMTAPWPWHTDKIRQ